MGQLNRFKCNEKATLFSLKGDFRLVELGAMDANSMNDGIRDLKNLVCSSQGMYPDIERWFNEKVIPGLRSSGRFAYVGYENNKPIASAILKRGARSKICHLKINEDFQDLHLGQMFLTQMIAQVLDQAKEIYFTLPESLWASRSGFFQSFGFFSITKASRQYRSGDDELLCRAPIDRAWCGAIEKLPGLLERFSVNGQALDNSLLMSIRPKYVERILSGGKSVEIRKKFSKKWLDKKVLLYASRPTSAIVGEARIASITEGHPSEIWSHFTQRAGCSRSEYEEYTGLCSRVSAIELCNVERYRSAVPRAWLSDLAGRALLPPQSYLELNFKRHSGWEGAISLMTILNGTTSRKWNHLW